MGRGERFSSNDGRDRFLDFITLLVQNYFGAAKDDVQKFTGAILKIFSDLRVSLAKHIAHEAEIGLLSEDNSNRSREGVACQADDSRDIKVRLRLLSLQERFLGMSLCLTLNLQYGERAFNKRPKKLCIKL